MKIYIVTSGEYSDYRIRGVFSTQERANAYVEGYSANKTVDLADVNEWEVDELPVPKVHTRYYVDIAVEEGQLISSSNTQLFAGEEDGETADVQGQYLSWKRNTRTVSAWADSHEKALKLAAEYRQSLLRETKGDLSKLPV